MSRIFALTLVAALVCSAPALSSTSENVPTFNGSYGADRYSTLSQINRGNAGRMRPVCTFQVGKAGPMQSSLIVEDGVIFFTQDDDTYAMDARSCKPIWHSTYASVQKVTGIANRGVAYLDGVLYRGTMDSHLIALDAKTGKTLWDVQVSDSSDGSAVSGAPIAWQGKIFLGLSGAESGVKGKIMAFSTTNGAKLWTFDTVPTGNEAGADTWANADAAATGGGSWWTSASLDPVSGTVYFPVGNPAPDYAPASRAGANLYTDSEVALDANTGRLRWYFQLVPNDYHDWDTTTPPAMFTAANGKPMLAFGGKDGYLFLLDAATHALAAKIPVTTITNADKPITPDGTYFCPNMGVQWNGPAYNERDKLVYVNSVDWCSTIKLGVAKYVKGTQFLGSTNGSGVRGAERTGWLHAVDPTTGKIAWQYHADGPMVAGITTTAGGLIFTGEYTGLFDVFDSANGKVLYQYQTGAPMAGGVVTYAVGGKQYVAASSGNTSVASLRGSGAGTVYVFAL
jgi:alcohol dehydrogenase (cytochrome c)